MLLLLENCTPTGAWSLRPFECMLKAFSKLDSEMIKQQLQPKEEHSNKNLSKQASKFPSLEKWVKPSVSNSDKEAKKGFPSSIITINIVSVSARPGRILGLIPRIYIKASIITTQIEVAE